MVSKSIVEHELKLLKYINNNFIARLDDFHNLGIVNFIQLEAMKKIINDENYAYNVRKISEISEE